MRPIILLDTVNIHITISAVLIILGLYLVIFSSFVVVVESSVHAILFLMLIMVISSQIALALGMEFLCLIYIIIYIGAVCVLMLFHIKLLKTFVHRFDNFYNSNYFFPVLFIAIILPLITIIGLCTSMYDEAFEIISAAKVAPEKITYLHHPIVQYVDWSNYLDEATPTEVFGYLLFSFYFVYLIIGGLILLIAMIGSIYLTINYLKDKKKQELTEQVNTDLNKTVFEGKNIKK